MSPDTDSAEIRFERYTEEIAAIVQQQQDIIDANTLLLSSGAEGAINEYVIAERDSNGDILAPLPVIPDAANYVLKLLDGGGNTIYEREVDSNQPFRVDVPQRRSEYIIEISGQYPVQRVVLATSVRELKDG